MTERPADAQTAPAQFIAEQLPIEGSGDKTYSGKNGQIHWLEYRADGAVINLTLSKLKDWYHLCGRVRVADVEVEVKYHPPPTGLRSDRLT